jgi:hypothetical protein
MQINKLVKMANQIAANCNVGDADKAASATADHMMRFWAPDMLAAIVAHSRGGAADLNEVAGMSVAEIARSRSNAA